MRAWHAPCTRMESRVIIVVLNASLWEKPTMNICQITMSKILTFAQFFSSADVEGCGAASFQRMGCAATSRGRLLWEIRWRKG